MSIFFSKSLLPFIFVHKINNIRHYLYLITYYTNNLLITFHQIVIVLDGFHGYAFNLLEDSPARFVIKILILMGMSLSDGVVGKEREMRPQTEL